MVIMGDEALSVVGAHRCGTCHAVMHENDVFCNRCGGQLAEAVCHSESVGESIVIGGRCSFDGKEGAQNQANALMRFTRWIMVITIAVAGAAFGYGLTFEKGQAQASSLAQEQLTLQRQDRSLELISAMKGLEALHRDLVERRNAVGHVDPSWIESWRHRLVALHGRYRLDGHTNNMRNHRGAEEGLRNAMLYLSSLERKQTMGGSAADIAALEASFARSLEEARQDLL